MPTYSAFTDALARYTFPPMAFAKDRPASARAIAPQLADEQGEEHPVYIPSPLATAHLLRPAIEAELGPVHRLPRSGNRGALVTADGPVAEFRRVALVRELLRNLPDRDDVDSYSAYHGIRAFRTKTVAFERYVHSVARQLTRKGVFDEPAPAPKPAPAPASPPKTPRERMAASRARQRRTEEQAVRDWLIAWRAQYGPGVAGKRLSAETLADAVIADLDRPDADFVPSRRTVYRVADHVLGARVRTSSARFYVIPAEPNTTPLPEREPVNIDDIKAQTAAVRELTAATRELTEATRELYELQHTAWDAGDRLGALQAQRQRLAPVHDLAAHRARRAS